jgi:hypothetical protein
MVNAGNGRHLHEPKRDPLAPRVARALPLATWSAFCPPAPRPSPITALSPRRKNSSRSSSASTPRARSRSTIGRPSAAAGVTRDEAWIYSAYRVRNYTYQAAEVIERDVVAISFDADGVVSNVERFGLEDGQLVQLVAAGHGKLGARSRLLPAIDAQPGPCRSGRDRRLGDAGPVARHVRCVTVRRGAHGQERSNRSIGMLTLSRGRYRARLADSDADIRAAQRLRWRAFRADADAAPRGATQTISTPTASTCWWRIRVTALSCAAFRLMHLPSGAQIGRSYSAQFYELSGLEAFDAPMVEMGRFCIDPDRQDPISCVSPGRR